jgi:hypothetical protein
MLRTCQGEFTIYCKHYFLSCPKKRTARLGFEVKFLTIASEGETRNKGTELCISKRVHIFLYFFYPFSLLYFSCRMWGSVLWDTTPCSPVKVNRRFGGTYHLHLRGGRLSEARNQRDPENGGDVPSNRLLTINGLHGVISHKIELFICLLSFSFLFYSSLLPMFSLSTFLPFIYSFLFLSLLFFRLSSVFFVSFVHLFLLSFIYYFFLSSVVFIYLFLLPFFFPPFFHFHSSFIYFFLSFHIHFFSTLKISQPVPASLQLHAGPIRSLGMFLPFLCFLIFVGLMRIPAVLSLRRSFLFYLCPVFISLHLI